MKQEKFNLWVSNSKETSFFDLNLVIQNVTFYFPTSSDSKVKKKKFDLRISNLKFNIIIHKVELVTRKKNSYKHFRVSNSKWFYVCNSISLLESSEPLTRLEGAHVISSAHFRIQSGELCLFFEMFFHGKVP